MRFFAREYRPKGYLARTSAAEAVKRGLFTARLKACPSLDGLFPKLLGSAKASCARQIGQLEKANLGKSARHHTWQIATLCCMAPTTTTPTCKLVRAGEPYQGKQGLMYAPAISAETVGSQAIHMQLLTIPPGGRAKAHKHASHESAIYMLSGVGGMWYGDQLEQHVLLGPTDFLYIPADMPHLPYNPSATENAIAVIARTDPNEQESVVLLPHLDALHPE